MKKIPFLLLGSLCLLCHVTKAQVFTKQPLTIPGTPDLYSTFDWVDFDGDKDLDAIEVNVSSGLIHIYKNDNLTLSLTAGIGSSIDIKQYALKDYDLDGDVDILIANYQKVRVARNNGDLTFTLQDTGITYSISSLNSIQCIDIDADVDLDIILNQDIYLNNQGSYFKSLHSMPSNLHPTLAWADLNNDGLVDLVAARGQTYNSNPLFLFINQGDGVLKEDKKLVDAFTDTGLSLWLDADGDHDLDLLISEADNKITLLKNLFTESNNLTFQRDSLFASLETPKARVGDINLDGLPDIVVNGYTYPKRKTFLYQNTSKNNVIGFTQKDLSMDAQNIITLELMDVDNDLDLDIYLKGLDASYINNIYKNSVTVGTPAPVVPTNLQSTVGDKVVLSWDGAATSTIYNLEIKRNGNLFKTSLALADGKLLLPYVTPRESSNKFIAMNLPEGTYTWRLQAEDYAFRTSPFSLSNTFEILSSPTNLSLDSLELNKVRLNWTYSGSANPSFAVFRRSTNFPLTQVGIVPPGTTTFIDDHLPLNEKLEYMVKTVTGSAYSAPSGIVKFYSGQYMEQPFGQVTPYILSSRGLSADFNQDGEYDLELMGSINNQAASGGVFKNDGSGNYTFSTLLPMPTDPSSYPYSTIVEARDMDNDGDIDVCAITGESYSWQKLGVYANQGSSFLKVFETDAYMSPVQAAVSDFNNDGRPDLLYSYMRGNSPGNPTGYKILFQTDAGSFIDSNINLVSDHAASIGAFRLVDLNSDGYIDIFFSGDQYTSTRVFLNVNGKAFNETLTPAIPSISDVVFMDYNADGQMDFITRGTNGLLMYAGLGALKFSIPKTVTTSYFNGSLEVKTADLDLNGWTDLIFSDGYNTSIVQNMGFGDFAEANYKIKKNFGSGIVLTDMESDGDIDIVKLSADYNDAHSFFYKNLLRPATNSNSAPSAPTSISSTLLPGGLHLSWGASHDDLTPEKMISYNLWVSDATGKTWVHPETNSSGTFRSRLAPGNAGYKTFFTLYDLPAGTYTVKIQALDASFTLSGWSSDYNFTIESGPTDLSVERVLLNKINLHWTNGSRTDASVRVERKTVDTDYTVVAELPAGTTSFTDDGLLYNKIYSYRIFQVKDNIYIAPSNIIQWNTALWVMQDTNIPNVYGAMDVADYTQDGKMDLLVAGGRIYNGTAIDITHAVYENTVSGWSKQDVGSTTLPYTANFKFYDFNGDSKLDIYENGYVYNQGLYKSEIFLNNGNKTFSSSSNIFTTSNYGFLSGWDYDMDNDEDIFVTTSGNNVLPTRRLLKNSGSGTYTAIPQEDYSCTYSCSLQVVAGDFDRDGDEDVFKAESTGYRLYLNSSEGLKRTDITIATYGSTFQPIDYDGDGWLDLMLLTFDYNYGYQKSRLFRNLGMTPGGGIAFQLVKDDLPYGNVSSNVADFDHDGDLDIIITAPRISIYSNLGNGKFELFEFPGYTIDLNNTKLVDFDNDGDLDIFVSGYMIKDYYSYDITKGKIILNQLITDGKGIKNQAPAQPSNLVAHQDSVGMHLTWDVPPDDHTTTQALTYDVILFKDGKIITKAAIDPTTGSRMKLQSGRSVGKEAVLNNLELGNYTWRVQAVDQSYLGSPLSITGNFTFQPSSPIIRDTIIYKCGSMNPITLTAKGQNIEWYGDKNLTNLIASGQYHPQTSQVVYVIQNINGVKGIYRKEQIKIFDFPDKPILTTPNPLNYCEDKTNSATSLHAIGENLKWYTSQTKGTALSVGEGLNITLSPKSYFVTQTINSCEGPTQETVVAPVSIDSRIYFDNGKITTNEHQADAYHWYRNEILVPEADSYSIDFDGTSVTYQLKIQKNSCLATSQVFNVTEVEGFNSTAFTIYPNPSTGDFKISLPANSKGTINIYDIAGNIVYRKSLQTPYSEPQLISASVWDKGLYMIHWISDKGQSLQKIVIF